jgi:hypothetical protein
MEVRVGFEPTNICFAGSGLGPLGHLTMILRNWLPATVTIRPLRFWRPTFCQHELAGNILAVQARLELATHGLTDRCSTY